MDTFIGDVRHALRGLRRSPGFALTCILMLAVGIGASTALFSVVEGVLLRPLPYPAPERLMQVSQVGAAGRPMRFSDPNFEDVQARSRPTTCQLCALRLGRRGSSSRGVHSSVPAG